MSIQTHGSNENDPPISPSMLTRQKIYLYVLRHTTIEEKFKIRAYFNNDIKFTFTRIETVDDKAPNSPYIYRAEVDVVLDNQRHLLCNTQIGLLPIQYYRIRLSRKIFNTDTTYRDYNDEKDRYIDTPYSISHYFIFDVDFARNLVDSPPGKNRLRKRNFNENFVLLRIQCPILESIVYIYILYSST
jgi:hypothetical protein